LTNGINLYARWFGKPKPDCAGKTLQTCSSPDLETLKKLELTWDDYANKMNLFKEVTRDDFKAEMSRVFTTVQNGTFNPDINYEDLSCIIMMGMELRNKLMEEIKDFIKIETVDN